MKKRFLGILMAAVMCMAAGCGSKEAPAEEDLGTQTTETEEADAVQEEDAAQEEAGQEEEAEDGI